MDAKTVRAFVQALPDNELSGDTPFSSPGAGLRRTTLLLDTLGRPDVRYLIAQVAGTNGKGSTAAMLAAILEAAGARTGLYTSPHLRRWEERVRISGVPIDDVLLARAGGLVIDAAMQLGPDGDGLTRFEFWTALACVAFAEASCRAAVLEVGLGGRYDATTAARVDLAVITRIGLDHTAVLGDTRARIAAEKAAIIRRGVPVVCAPQEEEALQVVVDRARDVNVPLLLCGIGKDVTWGRTADGLDVTVLGQSYESLQVPLRGEYQDENAATAVAAALALGTLGIKMRPEMVAAGMAAARWPGRFEIVGDVVIDGAHNPDGAAAFAAALLRDFPEAKFTLVFGCHRDKDLDGMLASLAQVTNRLVAVRARHPRARPAVEIADAARRAGFDVQVADSVSDGVAAARAQGGMVAVCGSLAIVGEARAALGLRD